jgi:histidine kinase/DNA gyrase B/HSP90-like ATPase
VKTATLILRSSTRMSQMVSDLIDFTRTRLGDGLPLVRRPMDLGVAAQEAIEEIRAVYPEHTVRLAKSGDLRGSWDEGRMKQALTNLIENAAQHVISKTPITVSVSGDGEQVVLTVHNPGPPIPEPNRARIFEPLVRCRRDILAGHLYTHGPWSLRCSPDRASAWWHNRSGVDRISRNDFHHNTPASVGAHFRSAVCSVGILCASRSAQPLDRGQFSWESPLPARRESSATPFDLADTGRSWRAGKVVELTACVPS